MAAMSHTRSVSCSSTASKAADAEFACDRCGRVFAERDGVLRFGELKQVGFALVELGGGRVRLGDAIDYGVGIRWHRVAGEAVRAGEAIGTIHHRNGRGLERARALLAEVGHSRQVNALAFDRGVERLLTSSNDSTPRLWRPLRTADGLMLRTMRPSST